MTQTVTDDAPTAAERRANPRFPSDVSVRLPDRRFFITYKGDVSAGGHRPLPSRWREIASS